MKAYKLLRVRKDGSIGSLFINKRRKIPVGEWIEAEDHKTKGYAHRPGWHTTIEPNAPHLSIKDRKWFEVEIEDWYELKRPESQGGTWYIANKMKIIKELNVQPT